MRHTKIGATTHAEHGSDFSIDVMMATYLRIMVRPWDCPGHRNVCEVVVYKSSHKAGDEPILTVRYTSSHGQMVLMDEALAEKVAKKIQANPYRYLRYEIIQNEVI